MSSSVVMSILLTTMALDVDGVNEEKRGKIYVVRCQQDGIPKYWQHCLAAAEIRGRDAQAVVPPPPDLGVEAALHGPRETLRDVSPQGPNSPGGELSGAGVFPSDDLEQP